MAPHRIIWHHTADADPGRQLVKVDAYHRSRGFARSSLGYNVGYHFLVEWDGLVVQTRKETEIGAHTKGINEGSIGVCLAGNFNLATPSEAQKDAAAALIGRLTRTWHIPLAAIAPHRKYSATDCPGRHLSDWWIVLNYVQREASWLSRLVARLTLPSEAWRTR